MQRPLIGRFFSVSKTQLFPFTQESAVAFTRVNKRTAWTRAVGERTFKITLLPSRVRFGLPYGVFVPMAVYERADCMR